MNTDTKEFIHELAQTYPWSRVDELIFKINPTTSNIVSLHCRTIQPSLTFKAHEYTAIEDIGDILHTKYSTISTCQDPPYSEADIVAYEDQYNAKLPKIARIFLTRVSKSLVNINKSPNLAFIPIDDDFEYGVCDFNEYKIYYENPEKTIINNQIPKLWIFYTIIIRG